MSKDDVFTAMIREELNQYQHYFFFNEKQWLKEEKFSKLAKKGLWQAKIMGVFVIFSILLFSVFSVYHFVQYGDTENNVSLWLGIGSWGFVIISTIFYTRDILEKKKSMERILKLLEVRKDFYESNNKKTVN